MILKPHQINGPFKPHSPASTLLHKKTKDAHQPFQQQQPPNDIFKVVSAKKAGNSFIKNLNLSESLYPHKFSKRGKDSDPEEEQNLLNKTSETHVSDLVFPRYTFSGEKASNKLMKIITSPSPGKKESNPLSLDLKKLLNPREIRKSQATSQFQNFVNKIEKKSSPNLSPNFNKSQLKEENQSFAFSDFDEFVEALSQPSRHNKVHYVQDLVYKIKPSPEYSRDSAFKKHSRSVSPNEGSFSRSPSDQQYIDFINMKKRENGIRTRSTTEERARKPSNVLTNKSVFPSFDHSPTRMGYTMTPGDISGEKNPQSFEEYLNDHGVGISLFSHNMTAETPAPTKILTINEGVHHQPQQPGILNELTTDSKISQAHNNGVFISNESQNNDMLASLQFFLRENLKEMGEIKNILKEQGSPVHKPPEEQSQIKPYIFEKDEDGGGDDKLQRELIKLATRIQELERENASLQQSTQANTNNTNTKIINQGGLKSGTVKISQIIKSEVNIQSATLEEILEDFELKEKYLMVASDQITISENMETESNQEEVKIERIEYITSFEKSGSYYFVIKLGQVTREKSRSQNSRSSPLKPSPFENKMGSYLIELIDKKEAADWETVFFFINFKALARKGNLQQNRIDFINSLKLFLSRYADCNGDNVLIFGDTFHVHSEKQNLNPSISNISKHSQSFDPIPEILHETSQTTEHEPIEIPEAEPEDGETNKKMTLQLQPVEAGSKKSIPATQKSIPAPEEDEDEDEVIRERDSEDEEDEENEMMPENNVQEEMIFSIGDEALALEDNKNSSIYQDTRRETVSKENQEFSKNLTSLLEGFTLEKYGKWGTKREKLVRVSNDFTGLEWRDLKKPKRLPDSISVDFIERIEVAGRSSYFQKKKMADGELNLCISVISTEREVNLKAPDLKTRENFVSSLQFILNERVKLQKLATHMKAEKERDLKREKY